jgi:hypothetical protein
VSVCSTWHKKRCMSIKFFNRLPNWIADLVQHTKKFIDNLKGVLMEQSFYLVNNFIDYCRTL